MADRETHVANFFETELTRELGPTDLVAEVMSTGGLQSPAFLVIEPDDPNQREVILFDGAFTDTEFRTTSIANRYLEGSAQPGGLTHPPGSVVRSAPLAQHIQDLNDRITSLAEAGFRLLTVVYFTSSGQFRKADYPGLRAVIAHVQGGGGGSGGAAATTGGPEVEAAAGGGGGGGYARKLVLVDDLKDVETVTVGAGGAAASAGFNDGGDGGASSFGTHARATGGEGGQGGNAQTAWGSSFGGAGGVGTAGDLLIPGGPGGNGLRTPSGGLGGLSGFGGHSYLGAGGRARRGAFEEQAEPGRGYGGGASGAVNNPNSNAKPGAAGAPGIVIVEVFV